MVGVTEIGRSIAEGGTAGAGRGRRCGVRRVVVASGEGTIAVRGRGRRRCRLSGEELTVERAEEGRFGGCLLGRRGLGRL